MRLRRLSPDAWEIQAMHPLFAGLLAELPDIAAAHHEARERLYPEPSLDEAAQELREDWREHVQPDLEHLFASNRELVRSDLAPMKDGHRGAKLVIPSKHIDAWLNALNQARFVTVAANRLTEADLDGREPPDLATPRGAALLRVHFYAHLQELLVEAASE